MITQSYDDTSIAERLEFASTLARKVGLSALQFWEDKGVDALGTQIKGTQDFVTEADIAAEKTIRSELALAFPDDGFVGEESGGLANTKGYWVVDPIDGTSNYLRGLKHWGVSIAYVLDNTTVLGVIHDTPTDRIYSARLGGGAYRDGQQIKAANTHDLCMAVGILGASRRTAFEPYLDRLRRLYNAGVEHRKMGSAAIGIVRVAEGVVDFYYEEHLNSWDALAALLIAQEAGAQLVFPLMNTFMIQGGEVFCAAPALSKPIEDLLINNVEMVHRGKL